MTCFCLETENHSFPVQVYLGLTLCLPFFYFQICHPCYHARQKSLRFNEGLGLGAILIWDSITLTISAAKSLKH